MRKVIALFFVFFVILGYAEAKKKALNLELRSPNGPGEAKRLQQEAAWELGVEVEKEIDLGFNVELKLILIPAGQFYMGSDKKEKERHGDEGPQHLVKITKPFYMGRYEVTQAQYKAVAGVNKNSKFKGGWLPVENINFYEVNNFLRMLYGGTKLKFRLPTEAEWEYACRAGTVTPFYFGETIKDNDANYDARRSYGKEGRTGAYLKKTVNVGSYRANAFGLYDMHGNVWEWCSDIYWNGYYKKSPENDPQGAENGKKYVIRGGAWNENPEELRSARRDFRGPGADKKYLGFRVVLDVSEVERCDKQIVFTPPTGSAKPSVQDFEDSREEATIGGGQFFGGSLLVHASSEDAILQGSFLKKNSSDESAKADTSEIFKFVRVDHKKTYLNHAKIYGYRYVLASEEDGSYIFYDLLLKKNKPVEFTEDYSDVVSVIEKTTLEFEQSVSNKSEKQPVMQTNELVYDEKTKKGHITVLGKGFEARDWMVKKIEEVCSSKNIVIQAGTEPEPGFFRVLSEKLQDGKYTIEFEAVR